MKVQNAWHGRVLVVALQGEIDMIDDQGMGDALQAVATAGAEGIVLDFAQVTYIASLGLGMLLSLAKEARKAKTPLRIINANLAVRGLLDTSKITTTIPLEPSLQSAIAACTPAHV